MKTNRVLLLVFILFLFSQDLFSQSGNILKEFSTSLAKVNKQIQPFGVKLTVPYTKLKKRLEYWKKYWEKFDEKVNIEKFKTNLTGSGVIIGDSGYIVTNNHVIEDATDSILVTLNDGRKYYADIVGTDPITDLALLRIYEFNLPKAEFGNSNEVEPGNLVIALGNPLKLTNTITWGIVSAIGRGEDDNSIEPEKNDNEIRIRNYIQTDAAINPGNSGGGLFTMDGRLIGINTELYSVSGYYIGYGFATPSNMVKSVITDLLLDGNVDRGYLGIDYCNMDESNAKRLKFNEITGIMITEIGEKSPAENYNLKINDIIYEVDNIKIKNSSELRLIMTEKLIGATAKFNIFRNGKDTVITVTLGKAPGVTDKSGYFSKKASLNAIMKEETTNGKQHLVFSNIYEFGAADKVCIFKEDKLISIDGKEFSNINELDSYLSGKKPGDMVKIVVDRDGRTLNKDIVLYSFR